MKTILIFLANGFEETEAVTPIDVWRRAGYTVKTTSISDNFEVTGSHNITIKTDQLFSQADFDSADLIFLPGGMPGAKNLDAHQGLAEQLKKFNSEGKTLAAICAAPMVLGHNGILAGKRATCFPGFEKDLIGAHFTGKSIEKDGNVITGKGAGAALVFALEVVATFSGKDQAHQLAIKMQVP
jgi:protein deglycase